MIKIQFKEILNKEKVNSMTACTAFLRAASTYGSVCAKTALQRQAFTEANEEEKIRKKRKK